MRLFSIEKLRTVLERSKWSRAFLGLALLQLIAALAFLIPTIVNVRTMYYLGYSSDDISYEAFYKSFKIFGECIMFIAFEIWKLLLAFDGVLHSNSRTIWASASFSIFSFGFSIMMSIESLKWIGLDVSVTDTDTPPEELEPLKYTNLNLLIALSCISFLIIPATFYSAVKVSKDYGWDVYKKIGSSIKIQEMYITVQWFSLALKIDIYFEFCASALYFIYLATNFSYTRLSYIVASIMVIMLIVMIPSFAFSRYAISKESKIMMILFILFQVIYIACMGFIMAMRKNMLVDWYAFTAFFLASHIAAVGTIVLAIMCLLNFNKGLKEFVQWNPFSRKIPKRRSTTYNNMNQIHLFDRLEDQRINEPIDD